MSNQNLKDWSAQIFNLKGELVKDRITNVSEIDISNLEAQKYILLLQDDEKELHPISFIKLSSL